MPLPPALAERLALPVIGAPMFIISQPDLVIAQCRAGVVGSVPSLNARPSGVLEEWLRRLTDELSENDAPFAVNPIVDKSNGRLEEDLDLCIKHKVSIVITSLGAREDVNHAIKSYGGFVFHDVINNTFARKAVDKGADGLIAVAAGAGGHAGTTSPLALVQEIRVWFDGPLALSGSITTGDGVLAAQAMGADLAYIGSAFIATDEANASAACKQMLVDCTASDIVYSDHFTGIYGNYLRPSIRQAGLDPDNLPSSNTTKLNIVGAHEGTKAWRDIWGAGQGIDVMPVSALVGRLHRE